MLFTDPISMQPAVFYNIHKIIVKPMVIWELLILFEYLQEDKQLMIIEEITKCLEASPSNVVSLVKKTIKRLPNNKTQNILEFLINLGFNHYEKNPKIADKIFRLVGKFFKYNTLSKSHLDDIYSYLAGAFYANKITTDNVNFAVGLLQDIFTNQASVVAEPQSFFYFSGAQSGILLNPSANLTWPFANGIALNIWFYLDEAHAHILDDSNHISADYAGLQLPKLFTAFCKGAGGFELFFVGTRLCFRNLAQNYDQPTILTQATVLHTFEVKTWYALGIEFEKPKMFGKAQINVTINQELKHTINHEFPKVSTSAVVSHLGFGENFIGRIASIIVYKAHVPLLKLAEVNTFFKFGIQQNQQLKNLNIPFEKIPDRILLIYTPIRAGEESCEDIYSKLNGLLMENTGCVARNPTKQKLAYYGGVESVLPFFYLLRFCERSNQGPNMLNETLKLLILILKNKPENQIDAARLKFFKVVGQLLCELVADWIDKETVRLLKEINYSLTDPRLHQEFFMDLLWKLDIYDKSEFETRAEIFSFLRGLYTQKPIYYSSLFGTSQILDLILDRYDIRDQSDSIENQNFENNAKSLLSVIEAILSNGGSEVSEEILPLFKAFSLRLSPQLHLMIFNTLGTVLLDQPKEKTAQLNSFMSTINDNRVLDDLFYLFANTVDIKLRAKCITFTNLILSSLIDQSEVEFDMINYHRHLLRRANPNRKQSIVSEDDYEMILNTSDSKNSSAIMEPEQEKKHKALSLGDSTREESETLSLLAQFKEESMDDKLNVMKRNLRGRFRTINFPANYEENKTLMKYELEKSRARSTPALEGPDKKPSQKKRASRKLHSVEAKRLMSMIKKKSHKKGTAPADDEEEKVNLVSPEEEKKEEVAPKQKKEPKFKKNMNLGGGLELDVENINKDFTVGWGDPQKIVGDDSQGGNQLSGDVDQLAKVCVQYMKGEKTQTDFYENKMPDLLPNEPTEEEPVPVQKEQEETKNMPVKTKANTTEPEVKVQSLRNKTKKTAPVENMPGRESEEKIIFPSKSGRPSVTSQSKRGSVEPRLARKSSEEQSKENEMLETLYYALMEWMLGKYPSNSHSDLIIDDADIIRSPLVMEALIEFFNCSNDFIKQKMIQDTYMLVKWNSKNCRELQAIPEFIPFLLEVLYTYQYQLFDSELNGASASIWELGCKVHSMLLKTCIIEENESYRKIVKLFGWITNKKAEIDATPYSTRAGKSVFYLGRHLWNHLIDSIEDVYIPKGEPGLDNRPTLSSFWWKNFSHLVFYTEEVIAYMKVESKNTLTETNEGMGNSFSRLLPYMSLVTHDDEFPFNFKNIISESTWIDLPLIESILRIGGHLWSPSLFPKRDDLDANEISKKIIALMEIAYVDEFSKALTYLSFEPLQTRDPKRGSLVKILLLLTTNAIDVLSRQNNIEKLTVFCSHLERIFQFYLIASENCRDKRIIGPASRQIIANLTCLLQFLYITHKNATETRIAQELSKTLTNCIAFLLSVIDFINGRMNNFDSFEGIKESSLEKPTSMVSSYTLISYELFKNILSIDVKGSLVSIEEIKELKLKNFASLETILTSPHWTNAFMDNPAISDLTDQYYSEDITSFYEKIASMMNIRSQKLKQEIEKHYEMTQESARRCENDVMDRAVNILEMEDTRKHQVVAFEEERVRIAKSLWTKNWKELRTYIGQWKHPQFYHQCDKKYVPEEWEKMKENEIYYRKISKYETKSRMRPFIKVKLIDPPHVQKYNELLGELKQKSHKTVSIKPEMFYDPAVQNMFSNLDMISPGLANVNKTFSANLSNIGKKIRKTFLKAFAPSSSKEKQDTDKIYPSKLDASKGSFSDDDSGSGSTKEEIFFSKRCQWIHTLTLREGMLQITSSKLVFIYHGTEQKPTIAAMHRFKLSDNRRIFKVWPLEYIKEVQRRRHVTRKTALEFFLIDGTTLLFNFPSGCDEIVQKLVQLRKTACPNLVYLGTLEPRKLIEKAHSNKNAITKRWMNYEISNFEYLMALNTLAGRSYKDIVQYPVFPWILEQYRTETIDLDDPEPYRDLTKNMGQLGSDERVNFFLERYENVDPFNPTAPFHFGSHYSSPAITLQFLIRLAPFTSGAKELQGGRFDLADRLFFSIAESYKAATEELADVRELIPEFTYLPDFLINADKLDFGKQQTGNRVSHVEMPKWSKRNPYVFIAMQRLALESDIVSRSLHNWIDLIFGYKQRGKEAEKAMNVFYYLTYEDAIDLDSLSKDPSLQKSLETQAIHFGQTPSQLFTKPHPQRPPREFSISTTRIVADPLAELKIFVRPNPNKKKEADKSALSTFTLPLKALIKLTAASQSKLVGLRRDGTITYFHWVNQNTVKGPNIVIPFSCLVEKEKKIQIEKTKGDFTDPIDRTVNLENYPATFLNSCKILVVGGFWDGKIGTINVDQDHFIDGYYNHNDTVTVIVADKKENFLISGSKCGECFVWKITPEYKLSLKYQYYDHEDMVTSIYISNELRLFASASLDGKINLYNLFTGTLIRSLFHPISMPIHNVILASNPIPSIIFFSNEDRTLVSYSINGQFLESVTDESIHVLSPHILKDLNSIECLVYGNEKGDIYMRELPFLNLRRRYTGSSGSPVLSILLTKDRRFLLFGCGDGEISVLTEPVQSSKPASNSFSQPSQSEKAMKSPEKMEESKGEAQPLRKSSNSDSKSKEEKME